MAAKPSSAGRATVKQVNDANRAIGELFDRLIRERFPGLTNQQVGDRIGCTDESVSQLRNGKITSDTPIFKKACKALRVEVEPALEGRMVEIPEPGPQRMLEKLLASDAHKETLRLISALYRDVFRDDG